jgi:hypothetical protein
VLVKTLACGICGSDLHARKHAHRMANCASISRPQADGPLPRRGVRPRILLRDPRLRTGHAAQASSRHPGLLAAGAADGAGPQGIGYSNDNVGGYAERMLLSEALLLEVPNGLRRSTRR